MNHWLMNFRNFRSWADFITPNSAKAKEIACIVVSHGRQYLVKFNLPPGLNAYGPSIKFLVLGLYSKIPVF